MEKRRTALQLVSALGLIAPLAALACEPAVKGTRVETARYALAYRLSEVAVSRHFTVEVGACAKSGPPPETLKIDAQMPEHRHGMNYRPQVKRVGSGHWRAEGLMFHMPGKWELVFELDGERLASEMVVFSQEEKARILSHGPWPPKPRRDPSNRVSGKPEAIALGERLFFEPRLSSTGSVLCATCHAPFRAFQDARARGFGLEEVDRNTPSLVNVGSYRWYGWDGAHDSLWAQSLRPLLDPREMHATPGHVAAVLKNFYQADYQRAFGRPVPEAEEALVDVGKALAAYQETLVSARTPFDQFRDALERDDAEGMSRYPLAAQRGLALFVGKGNCSVCHFGPHFTNGEFADAGVGFFAGPGRVDPGRHDGIKKLKANPHNLLGRFNDDATQANAIGTQHVELQHRNFGEFRVPGLRNVELTAPYMHNGSLATLRDVVRHYSELNEQRLHADGERILRKLSLSARESEDLVLFLQSLTSP
ncbi:MAG TPA: cytochrome c peroxidase [Burkholderiales bacterium]|nr:cytochrome c peroxidase [Burkholderiales bacterium]